MKYIKYFLCFTCMAFVLGSCKTEDLKDDIEDLKNRVTMIEEQIKILNENIEVFAYILDPQQKTIKSVTLNSDGTAYIIVLSDDTTMELTIGKQGTVSEPEITIDENDCWVINGVSTGVKAKGEDGENGDGYPEFKVEDGKWMVRFGAGNWEEVPGGDIGQVQVGDQFFESAEVVGDTFVITMKDGKTQYRLPIVAGLTCAIVKEGMTEDGTFVLNRGERIQLSVKIEGGKPLAPIYPAGWRAELTEKTEADEDGTNYVLTVYAPSTASQSRAVADNSSDVTVRVSKGAFWAIDKIKVSLVKSFDNNYDSFVAGKSLQVAGYEFSMGSLGISELSNVHVVESGSKVQIKGSGVYFVKGKETEFVYQEGLNVKIDYLIILPYQGEGSSKLTINKQIYLNKTFVAKGVNLVYADKTSYPIRVATKDQAEIVLEGCKIEGLLIKSGFVMPDAADKASVKLFNVDSCDFRIENVTGDISAKDLYLFTAMDCSTFRFVNNLVYRATETNGQLTNFKIYNANARVIGSLHFDNNTIVNLNSGTTALVYASQIGEIKINKNIYYNEEPVDNSSFIRYVKNMADESKATGSGNIGNSGNKNFKVCFVDSKLGITCPEALKENNDVNLFKLTDIFSESEGGSMDCMAGVFKTSAKYKEIGAQR